MTKFILCLLCILCGACQVDAKTGKGAASIIGRGVVNSPSNKSLRFDMLTFGLKEFCAELLETGTPLRLADGQPVMGRFFGKTCQAKRIDAEEKSTIFVQFSGQGYAWTAGTGRMGFHAQGLLELAPDFRIYKQAMYVYFRPVQVDTSDFKLLMSERPLAQAAASIMGLNEEELGRAIISAQLGRGFTAIRYDADGNTDFALGLVDEGHAPFRQFQVLASPRTTVANGRTEFFAGEMDYLGKFAIKEYEQLSVSLQVEGTSQIDFAVLSAAAAEPYLQNYIAHPGVSPLPVVPSFVASAHEGAPTRAQIQLPAGEYFVILDHSKAIGNTSPAAQSLPARVDYLLQTGRIEH